MSASAGRGLDHHGLEFRRAFCGIELLLQVGWIDAQAFFNSGKTLLQLLRIVAQEKNAERRVAIDEHAALPVQHRTARCDDGNRADAVAFGEIREVFGLDDLQLPETHHQKDDACDRNIRDERKPALRDLLVVNVP